MILGSVAYRGSFNRRSAVTIAGSLTLTVSNPPSISLVTARFPLDFSIFDANVACNEIYINLKLNTVFLKTDF